MRVGIVGTALVGALALGGAAVAVAAGPGPNGAGEEVVAAGRPVPPVPALRTAPPRDEPRPAGTSWSGRSPADVLRLISGYRSPVSGLSTYDDLTDLLPNARIKRPSGTATPACDLVVHGRIVAIEPDRGYVNNDNFGAADAPADKPELFEVPFDDPSVQFRTVRLTVEVLDRLGPGPTPETIEVGLSNNGHLPLETLREALATADSFVFFLNSDSAMFAGTGLYAVQGNLRETLTVVRAGGGLYLPGEEDQEQWLRGAKTLAELTVAADGPDRTISPAHRTVGRK